MIKKITSRGTLTKRKPVKQRTCELFKEDHPEERVPGCGGLKLDSPLPDHILPPEVLLVNPTQEEIIVGGNRMIFLNTPLLDEELKLLQAVDAEIEGSGKKVPKAMMIQRLRLIQQAKNNVRKAVDQLEKNFAFRMQHLPLNEADVLVDLQKGGMYWGGRDFRCRPSLIIRAGRLDKDLMNDAERTTRLAVFLLEYMIRYGLCPGRVENWGVIVDLDNAGAHGIPPIGTINSLVTTLQGIYRYRMVWTKIVNAPWWFTGIWTGIKRVVPGESVKKVEILGSNMANLAALFEPAQLEERYGGGAPNLEQPTDFFPRKFAPGPFFPEGRAAGSLAGSDNLRLADITSTEFHEGCVWNPTDAAKEAWLPRAAASCLSPMSAKYVKATCNKDIAPIETFEQAMRLLQPPPPEVEDGTPEVEDGAEVSAAPVPPADAPDLEKDTVPIDALAEAHAVEVTPVPKEVPEKPTSDKTPPPGDESESRIPFDAFRKEGETVAVVADLMPLAKGSEDAPTLDTGSAPPTRGWCCGCKSA